jgi:hypothetical protein
MAALRQRPALYCARMRSLRKRLALYGLLLASCALNALIAHGQSGVRLTGTVRDGSGAYIPNALVRLFSADNVQATKTDAAGRFEFTGLSSGTYDLQASADGFLTKTVEDVQVDDQDVGPIQLLAPPGVHSGRCVVALKVPGDLSYEHRSDKTNLVARILDTQVIRCQKPRLILQWQAETKRKAQTTRGNFNSLVSVLGSTLYGSRLRAIGANPETCGSPVRI